MIARQIVEAAMRAVAAAREEALPEVLTSATPLGELSWFGRLDVVQAIEVALDGHASTRLGDAYQLRTVGELVEATAEAMREVRGGAIASARAAEVSP